LKTEPNESKQQQIQTSNRVAKTVLLARRTSLIDRLVKESDNQMQSQFDREDVRKRVVPIQSIFKDKATLRKALFDRNSLYNKISGNKDEF